MADDDDATAAQAAKDKEAADRLAAEAAARADAARRAEEDRLRAAALDEYEKTHEALWAQATAVVNVKALIPIVLDKATDTYTKWRGIFLTVLGKYALTRHALEDEAFPARPAWIQADCCVLTWIYGTVSSDLQQSLMMRQGSARNAWCYLEDEFLGQKESRALLLETQFRTFRQEALSITNYCRRLESMAASLADFGDPIGDTQMVLTLLRGLSGKFRHMVSILKMQKPFPTFSEARTHLLLEEMEIDARPPSPPAALVVAPSRPAAPGAAAAPRPGAPPPPRPAAPTGGQRNGRRRGRGGRGAPAAPNAGAQPGGQGSAYNGAGVHPSFMHPWAGSVRMWPYDPSGRPPPPQPAFHTAPHYGGYSAPPGAYGGTYAGPPPSYSMYHGGAAPPLFQAPSPSPAYQAAPWNPTHGGSWHQDSLAHSFNTMTLNPPTSEWYADSGAGSHMTSDAGFANQERDRQVQ
ncbi:programmed cell death 6-interacting protein-like [Oryza brachyantha]|uniref:programmed cell death 6-interacting protein-like n=1 Tax=Oryza brachyantha TaxID=4533 RepID=UPI001ADC11E2|nr:programmed cell death 6-interacting protein-like [Oryza brachyantha]